MKSSDPLKSQKVTIDHHLNGSWLVISPWLWLVYHYTDHYNGIIIYSIIIIPIDYTIIMIILYIIMIIIIPIDCIIIPLLWGNGSHPHDIPIDSHWFPSLRVTMAKPVLRLRRYRHMGSAWITSHLACLVGLVIL
jgi:hypothetical protein